MEFNRVFRIAFLFLALIAVGYYLSVPLFDQVDSEPSQPAFTHSIEDFRLVENPAEGEVWILTSPRADKVNNRVELIFPKIIYKNNSDTIAEISAGYGSYYLEGLRLRLREDVVLKRLPENQVFETEELIWDRARGILETEKHVKLVTPQAEIEAVGMFVDLAEERMELKSNVKWYWRR